MLIPILYSLVFLVFSARAVVRLVILLDLQEQLLSETGYEMKPVCRLYENKLQLTVIKNIVKLGCRELYLYFHFFSRNCFI
jgi:hypothetical protein